MAEEGESVKVAVRVRPFNKREIARDAKLIIDMKGASTYISDPENPGEEPRQFTFDYSYWSHDGCKEEADGYWGPDPSHPNGKKFADQKTVFADLGQGVLQNAWDGYNATLFAYGQTGSGKSWSVVGYGVNKGIVPQFCAEMFSGIEKKMAENAGVQYEVQFSMLEIYMEVVNDLLNPKKGKGGLKVRQHPKKGFYVDGLQTAAVSSYKDIENKMEEGTMNRTVAATNMNATSSRAHTIVGITFVQKQKNAAGEETAKSSIINLVDLAGSERAESTGATGDRLKEGAAINTSLSALGNVIAALAEQSEGKKVRVPFRDSVLTKLLKNALGGNSKTVMIAAVSPADINFDESLSTLRYADRAKQIKCAAKVNEDPTEKLIRELQEENERLKQMMEGGGVQVRMEDSDNMTDEELAAFKKEMEENAQEILEANAHEMEEMKKSFEEKLKASQEASMASSFSEANEKKKTVAHIYNLNFDPQLSGKIVHFVDSACKKIGNKRGEPSDICLVGPSIQENHCTLSMEGSNFFIEKCSNHARVLVNGEAINENEKTDLHHNDRLMFGTTQMFVFVNPKERDASGQKYAAITFEMAQEEIASNSGFDMNTANKSRDDMLLQEDLMEMLPAVEEANSISEELDKKMKFESIMVTPEARGLMKGRTEVMVKVTNLETGHEWVWSRQKFLDRKYIMQELFQKFDDDEEWDVPPEQDPFVEDGNQPVHLGTVKVWLQSLAYLIDMKEQLQITDYKGQEVGLLNVEFDPCDKKGKPYTDDDDIGVDDPNELLGKDIHFLFKINSARGLPNRFTDVYARYLAPMQPDYDETKHIPDTCNPNWNYCKQYSYPKTDQKLVKELTDGAVMIQIWGKQKPPAQKKHVKTRAQMEKLALAKSQVSAANNNAKVVDAGAVKFMLQSSMLKKREEKLAKKLASFKQMVEVAEKYQKERVQTQIIKGVLHASGQREAEKLIQKIPKDSGGGGQTESKTCTIL